RFCRPKKAPGRGYSPREALVEASGDGDSVNPNLLTERRSAAEDDGERGRRKEKRQRRKKFWRRLCCIDGSPSRDADKPKVEEIVQVQAAEAEPSREISDDPISLQDITFTIESHEPKYFEWVDGFPSSLGQINTETSDCLSEEIVVPTDQADTNEEPVKEDILSKYKMGYKLGQGGYGSIYTALRLADNLPVAVKIAQKSKSMEYINIVSTRNYCPPEYLSKGKYYGRSGTVYSLGVLLFFLVCEYFPDKSDKKKIKKRKWIDQRLSKECCHLLNSCLHPNPMKRIPLDELLLHDWFQ
ncbi:hypothetical protein DNTS_012842, partial [Danionella cerebrum]